MPKSKYTTITTDKEISDQIEIGFYLFILRLLADELAEQEKSA